MLDGCSYRFMEGQYGSFYLLALSLIQEEER